MAPGVEATFAMTAPVLSSSLPVSYTHLDLQSGINTPDSREANKKRIVKGNSSEVYVLADSSKSGKRTMCKAMELSECTIITEQETELLKEHANYILAKD